MGEVDVVIGIVLNGNRFLVERRRSDEKSDPCIVCLPGGHVESGESTEEALKREMREELGIEVKAMEFVCKDVYISCNGERQNSTCYLVTDYEGKPTCKSAQEIFWEDAIENLTLEVDRKTMRKLRKMRERVYPDRPLVCVGAIIVHCGKLLLIRRREMPGRGKWTIPGGLVELGESSEQAVIREVKEETNLLVQEPELVDVVNNIIFDEEKVKYHYVVVDYFVKVKGGKLDAANDAVELRWVLLDDVENYDLTKGFRGFFRRKRHQLEKLDSQKM